MASPEGQTFSFTNNLPGYSNDVTVRRITGPEFAGGPELYVRTYPFSGEAGPLSGQTIEYLDYRQFGDVSYTFATPLDQNSGILVMDVDFRETVVLSFFDAAGNLLSTAGWSATLIRSVTAVDDDPNLNGVLTTAPTTFTLVGSDDAEADPTWLFQPPAGQMVKRVVINGNVSGGANGT